MSGFNSLRISLLLVLFVLLSFVSGAQDTTSSPTPGAVQWSARDMTYRGKNYDPLDSSYYTKKQQKQFKKYQDHQYFFLPKPRNMYEVGFGFGLYNISSDIPSLMLWQKGGGGFHLHVRKSLGYMFSARIQYVYGVGKNLDVQPTAAFDAPYTKFQDYTPIYYATNTQPATPIYRATRTEASQLSLDLIVNVGNINFHQARNQLSYYAYLGIGGFAYKTLVNATDATLQPYNFGNTGNNALKIDAKANNKTVRKALQKGMDKTYDMAADNG
ncbi:MAG: hypothetical protein EBX41_10670, partial [Chitinophagia bacterium]|nr:hypothetical protein [Chitinophagia bacterium]